MAERTRWSWAFVATVLITASVAALALAILKPDRALGGVGVIGGVAALAIGDRAIKAIGLTVAAFAIIGLAMRVL